MHMIFFVALGELFVRWRTAVREKNFLNAHFLPEDDRTVLVSHDLGPIRRRVANLFDHENGFLPSLINLAVLQFQSSSSVEQAAGVMSQQLELMANRLDLRYGLVRFIAWVVPTLGFIGTVYSLGASLSAAGDPSKALDLHEVAKTLGVGFDCTMVALVESAILVFLLHLVQEREESALNDAGDYTLRNLINRLYAASEQEERQRMRARSREINIFNMSLLDILCGALGAFCFMMLVLLPYYKPPERDRSYNQEVKTQELLNELEKLRASAPGFSGGATDDAIGAELARTVAADARPAQSALGRKSTARESEPESRRKKRPPSSPA